MSRPVCTTSRRSCPAPSRRDHSRRCAALPRHFCAPPGATRLRRGRQSGSLVPRGEKTGSATVCPRYCRGAEDRSSFKRETTDVAPGAGHRERPAGPWGGVQAAAQRLVPGFAVPDPNTRESQLRTALRLLTKPPRGIPELVASARTFTAAVASDGLVLATDAKDENDRMTGVNLRGPFPVLRDRSTARPASPSTSSRRSRRASRAASRCCSPRLRASKSTWWARC